MTKWRDIPRRERRWAVYTIVRQLHPNAYTDSIRDEIERCHEYDISRIELTTYLETLENDGFLRHESKRHPDPQIDAVREGKNTGFWYPTGKPRPMKTTQSEGWEPGMAPA
jgi:hypothetical protein